MGDKELLDFYYAEYKRLSERSEKIMDASFEDFKLLGGLSSINILIGTGTAFSDIASKISMFYFFFVFLIMLVFMATLLLRDILRLNILYSVVGEIACMEQAIRQKLDDLAVPKHNTFNYIGKWEEKYTERQTNVFNKLILFLGLSSIILPAFFLLFLTYKVHILSQSCWVWCWVWNLKWVCLYSLFSIIIFIYVRCVSIKKHKEMKQAAGILGSPPEKTSVKWLCKLVCKK